MDDNYYSFSSPFSKLGSIRLRPSDVKAHSNSFLGLSRRKGSQSSQSKPQSGARPNQTPQPTHGNPGSKQRPAAPVGGNNSVSRVISKDKDESPYIVTIQHNNLNPKRSAESLARVDEIRNIKLSPEFKEALNGYNKANAAMASALKNLVSSNMLNGLMIYGSPGSGKSHTMLTKLDEMKAAGTKLEYAVIKGKITPLQLYEFVRKHCNRWDIVVFDDCDTVFNDETALNLLKAMTDTYEERVVSYRSRAASVPSFIFRGKLICITNMVLNGNPHFQAIVDRMPLYTYTLTFKQKFAKSIDIAISDPRYLHNDKYREAADYVITYMNDHIQAFNIPTYSLRTMIRLIGVYELTGPENFDSFVKGMKEFNWNAVPSSKTATRAFAGNTGRYYSRSRSLY